MSKEFKESLQLGKFTINKPKEWALDEVELEINDYDYVSTNITMGFIISYYSLFTHQLLRSLKLRFY